MELVKNKPANLDFQRGINLFLDLLDQHKKMPLCLAKVEIASRFGLALSNDQVLEIANDLLADGKIDVLKFVSRGSGFFDGIVCRNYQGKKPKIRPVFEPLGENEMIIAALNMVKEQPGPRSEVTDMATLLVGSRERAVRILATLEEEHLILVDHEHESGEDFIVSTF